MTGSPADDDYATLSGYWEDWEDTMTTPPRFGMADDWPGEPPQPIPDFPGFVAWMLDTEGATQNSCPVHCQDKGSEHVHLRHRDGHDGIIWADGRVSEYDLTQPARLIYPVYPGGGRMLCGSRCYPLASGSMVHVKPDCQR